MIKSESQTRKDIIDINLGKAGWNINDRTQVIEEFEIDTKLKGEIREASTPYGSYQFSDYVLLGKNGKPLAVVEAKKTSKDAEVGREQAKQYCYNIQKQHNSELPFCFYSNGLETYYWDLENYPPRKVVGFPTRDDLERFKYIRSNRKPLAPELLNTDIAGRDHQIQAIRSVTEAIEKRQQNFLLVMATGTGKTRTCIALVDILMRAAWAERVLFLVDRIALREQALNAFKEHLPNEPRWPKFGEKAIAKDRRIYISTYPTMLNIIRDDSCFLSPHFFDLIVIDESHRSIYNTYQEILDYFNTISLGLTATPTDIIDHNTFNLFNCEDGIPTFAFSYEEAIRHAPPYLCPFQVMKIHTRFQDEGISKRTISLEDQKKLILEGKDIEEINFEGTDLEKRVINRGTNALIVKEFMEESIKDANGVLPGKTIFFCTSISHARRVEKIFDSLFPEHRGELAKVIVSDDPRVYGKGGLLDQFTNLDMPRIAISVGMLDTGIDIREIVNLVFAKPIYSYTKFWQMIGRGTRLLEAHKIKPWCPEKSVFLIMDCWDNFEYFKINPEGRINPQEIPLPVRYVGIRLDKIEKAIDTEHAEIARKEVACLRSQIDSLPANSVVIMDAKPHLTKLEEDNFWVNLNHQKIEFLRNTIKPLFRTISQADFKDMRFRKDVLETSLALLASEQGKYQTLTDNLMEQISELPLSINIVAKEETLIRQSQTKHFWTKATDADMDTLADRLAPLMKFRESIIPPTGPTKFDLQDLLKTKEMVEFGPEHEALSVANYRELVEKRITELTASNPILQRIKEGHHITAEEAEELADFLNTNRPYITEDLLRKVYKNQQAGFIQFIRHILGIEILESFDETVSRAFDQFFREHSNLSTRQLEFLNLLRETIIERGDIRKRDLIQSPFTILHPQGIRGLFSPREIEDILKLTKDCAA